MFNRLIAKVRGEFRFTLHDRDPRSMKGEPPARIAKLYQKIEAAMRRGESDQVRRNALELYRGGWWIPEYHRELRPLLKRWQRSNGA